MKKVVRHVRVKALKSYGNGEYTVAKGEVFFLPEDVAIFYEKKDMVAIHDYPGDIDPNYKKYGIHKDRP